jgi:hypothetical protein
MQRSSKRVLGIVALLVVVLAGFFLLRQPSVPDRDQITAQLDAARGAAEQHSVGGIMKIVSAEYKDSNFNNDQLHFFLARVMRQSGRVTVLLSPPNVMVNGDSATSTSQVTVRSRETDHVIFDQPVTLNWRREEGHRLLVLPAHVWRVVGAQYSALPDEGT